MEKNILILGANGMLGHTIYKYLLQNSSNNVFGTTRKGDKDYFKFNIKSFKSDFKNILKKINSIDYIINCIGQTKNNSNKNYIAVNTKFSQNLSKLSDQFNFKLISVSTDAVFADNVGVVSEKDIPNSKDNYGISKLLGEPKSNNSISIRTSIIGIDPKKHKGFLEWSISAKEPIPGFINQTWAGCTTLQFAKLCANIIKAGNFATLRKKSAVFHFSPLGPLTKYELIKKTLVNFKIKRKIIKTNGTPITRVLKSNFTYFSNIRYNNDIDQALPELISFENKHE